MYKPGDDKLEVRELLVKAFASAWEAGDKAVDRDTYINSSIKCDRLSAGRPRDDLRRGGPGPAGR